MSNKIERLTASHRKSILLTLGLDASPHVCMSVMHTARQQQTTPSNLSVSSSNSEWLREIWHISQNIPRHNSPGSTLLIPVPGNTFHPPIHRHPPPHPPSLAVGQLSLLPLPPPVHTTVLSTSAPSPWPTWTVCPLLSHLVGLDSFDCARAAGNLLFSGVCLVCPKRRKRSFSSTLASAGAASFNAGQRTTKCSFFQLGAVRSLVIILEVCEDWKQIFSTEVFVFFPHGMISDRWMPLGFLSFSCIRHFVLCHLTSSCNLWISRNPRVYVLTNWSAKLLCIWTGASASNFVWWWRCVRMEKFSNL